MNEKNSNSFIESEKEREREMHRRFRETLSYNWNIESNQSVKHISSGATWKLIMKSRFQDNKRCPLPSGGGWEKRPGRLPFADAEVISGVLASRRTKRLDKNQLP